MPNTNETTKKREIIPWPESPAMKSLFCRLLTAGTIVFAIMAIFAIHGSSSGGNAMPAINLLASAILSATLLLTIKTPRTGWPKITLIVLAILSITILLVGLTNPPALIAGGLWGKVNLAAVLCPFPLFYVAVARYCYKPGSRIGAKKVGILTFMFIWWLTINLCVNMATASEAQVTGAAYSQGIQLTNYGPSGPTINPAMSACPLFLIALLIGTFLVFVAWLVCRAAHLCGDTNYGPPSSSGPSLAAAKVKTASLQSDGTTMSIDDPALGLLVNSFSNILSVNDVALWNNISGVHDANIDTAYPFVSTVNFSLMSTTNLSNIGWHTVCTIITSTTSDPVSPLVCMVIYTNHVGLDIHGNIVTNGVAIGTNRFQVFFDNHHMVTNAVVYGQKYPMPIDLSAKQTFYKSWINTNMVSTVGP